MRYRFQNRPPASSRERPRISGLAGSQGIPFESHIFYFQSIIAQMRLNFRVRCFAWFEERGCRSPSLGLPVKSVDSLRSYIAQPQRGNRLGNQPRPLVGSDSS